MRLSNGVVMLDDSIPTAGDLFKLQKTAAEKPAPALAGGETKIEPKEEAKV